MSIQSEISRLENGKQALKEVLAERGVIVPDDVLLHSYYEYVNMIQGSSNADTVDGLHAVVSETEATVDDRSVITFILGG